MIIYYVGFAGIWKTFVNYIPYHPELKLNDCIWMVPGTFDEEGNPLVW